MVEHIEGEALAGISLEICVEEVVPPLKEIPSMVELDAPKLREAVLPILGAKCVVGSGCREYCSSANDTSDEWVAQ